MSKKSRRPNRAAKADERKRERERAQMDRTFSNPQHPPADARPFELKLFRASEHLESFKNELREWNSTNPYVLQDVFDPQTGDFVVSVEVTEDRLSRFSLLAGESLQSLRTALDYLVHDLTGAQLGHPLPEDVARSTEFPIFGPKPMSGSARKRKIGALGPQAQEIIAGLQPATADDYESHPLWVLHELNNIDKHRLPLVVTSSPEAIGIMLPPDKLDFEHLTFDMPAAFEGRTTIFRYRPRNPVTPQFTVDLDIAFGAGSPAPHEFVTWTLRRLRDFIELQVARPLRRFLT